MEFILEDGTKMILTKDDSRTRKELVVEIFNKDGEFLERSRFTSEELYWKFF